MGNHWFVFASLEYIESPSIWMLLHLHLQPTILCFRYLLAFHDPKSNLRLAESKRLPFFNQCKFRTLLLAWIISPGRDILAPMNTPTAERVRAACKEFDREELAIEQALKELFSQYSGNSDLSHVLLKVVALNTLYSTQIFAHSEKLPNVVDVARHIHKNAKKIDAALAVGSPEIVETIAWVSVPGKKDRIFFSFATKYCSWHKPAAYPIYDSNVQRYLEFLQKQSDFAGDFNVSAPHWAYAEFREAMSDFRKHYRLDSFTFKEIDKFVWLEGAP